VAATFDTTFLIRRGAGVGTLLKGLGALALWLTSLTAVGASSAAAQTAPQLELRQFGWQADGALSPRSWNPVLVRVSGVGDDTLRVQATLKMSSGSANQTFITPVATYAQDVALPRGVTKDVKLWVPLQLDGTYLVTVQLLDSSGKVLAEQTTPGGHAARGNGAPLVATLADSQTLAAQIGKIEVPFQQGLTAQVQTATLAPADVPARAEYLSAFQALVVQGAGAASLTGEQKLAIRQWVVAGGDLVIVGGPDASRAAATLDGADQLGSPFGSVHGATDLQPLAGWVGGDAALSSVGSGASADIQLASAAPLAGPQTRPLAARTAWGEGSLTLLAADPTLDPLRGWSGTPQLLKRALEPALASGATSPDAARSSAVSQASTSSSTHPDDARLLSAVDALPAGAFPDWQHVALLLGGFALIAGPVLHLVLWRMDRRPWLWIAVPGLAIVVTAGIYAFAAMQPGHDVVANAISEIRVDPSTGDARQALAVGFFAPLHDRLSVHVSGEVPVRVASANQMGGGGLGMAFPSSVARGGPMLPGFRVVTGRDTQVEFTTNATMQNGLRSLVLSRTLSRGEFGQLESDLHVEGADGIVRGTVHNATPYALDQVGLAIGQTIAKVGPMAPGQTSSVVLDPRMPPPMAPGSIPYSFAWQLLGEPSSGLRTNGSSPTGLDLASDPETRRRLRVVDAVFSSSDTSSPLAYTGNGVPSTRPSAVRPMLVALSSDTVGTDVLPSVGAQRTFELSVLEVPVHLSIQPGPFTLSSALTPPSVTVDSGASLNVGATSGGTWLDLRGAATYTFRLDMPGNAHVDRLTISTQQAGVPQPSSGTNAVPTLPRTAGPSTQGTFSIYNWQTAAWQLLASGTQQVDVSDAPPFIGPDGSVRVKVTSGGTDRLVRFLPPELTLEGQAGS
jgi:hypothetical protein